MVKIRPATHCEAPVVNVLSIAHDVSPGGQEQELQQPGCRTGMKQTGYNPWLYGCNLRDVGTESLPLFGHVPSYTDAN